MLYGIVCMSILSGHANIISQIDVDDFADELVANVFTFTGLSQC